MATSSEDAIIARQTNQWVSVRKSTIKALEKLANDLDELSAKCNTSKLVGGGVSVVSGLVALGGIVFAPFTGGLSLAAIGISAATGIAGGTTLLVTDYIKHLKEDKSIKEVNTALQKDKEQTGKFYETIGVNNETTVAKVGKIVGGSAKVLVFVGRIATKLGSRAVARGGAAAVNTVRVLGTASKALKLAGPVLSVVFLPFDVADVVATAIDTHNGSVHEAASDIRKIIKELHEELDTVVSDEYYKKNIRGR